MISVITSDIELLEVFYAHTISPVAIAALFSIVMCLPADWQVSCGTGPFGTGRRICVVGIVIPLITSRRSGDDGLRFRTQSGALSGFVLDSLRGLSEILQYGQGKQRLAEMKARTEDTGPGRGAHEDEPLGSNQAVTNAAILVFRPGDAFFRCVAVSAGPGGF